MGFLSAATGVLGLASAGVGLAGALGLGGPGDDPYKDITKQTKKQTQETTAAQKWANLLAQAQVPGTPEYEQHFIPYLNFVRQQQNAALRLGHREQERERQRQLARGVLQTYATGGRQLETRDADREMAFRALDYPSQVLARQQAVAGLLKQSADTGMAIPSAAGVSLAGSQYGQNQFAGNLGLIGAGLQAADENLPSWGDVIGVLGGQSSGTPTQTTQYPFNLPTNKLPQAGRG